MIFTIKDCLKLVKINFEITFNEKINFEVMDGYWYLNGSKENKVYEFWNKSPNQLINDFVDGVFIDDRYSSIAFFLSNYYELLVNNSDKSSDKFGRSSYECSFFHALGMNESKPFVDRLYHRISEDKKLTYKNTKNLFITHDIDHLKLPSGRDFLRGIYYSIKSLNLRWALQLLFLKIININIYSIRILYFIHRIFKTKGTFFYLTKKQIITSGGYDLNDLKKYKRYIINHKNHDIGLHYNDDYLLNGTNKIVLEAFFEKKIISGRAHYLIFDPLKSFHYLANAGILVDSSLGFHELIGFRNATSFPFISWDWISKDISEIVELPLIIMDVCVKSNKKGLFASIKSVKNMLDEISALGGNLTILWHNSSILGNGWFKYFILYLVIIKILLKKGFKSTTLSGLGR